MSPTEFAACWRLSRCCSRGREPVRRCRPLLGTFVEIDADDSAAIDLAFAAIKWIHTAMSAHDPDSEISQINRKAHLRPVAVSEWTAQVIKRALFWSNRSVGRFDVVRAGRVALDRGALPRHSNQPLPADADWTSVSITRGAVSLEQPGCLDLGGIAKGFAVDRAIDALKAAGLTRGLVNAGGDMRGFGADAWPVTVIDPANRRPLASVNLVDGAMATSAGIPTASGVLAFDQIPDRDPRWSSVTVRAPLACDADALTKIVWSGGLETGRCLGSAGAEAFVLGVDGSLEGVGVGALAA